MNQQQDGVNQQNPHPNHEPVDQEFVDRRGGWKGYFDTLKSNFQSKSEFWLMALKFVLFATIYIFMAVNALSNIIKPQHVPQCLRDLVQEDTQEITDYLRDNPKIKHGIMIVGSFILDLMILVLASRWIVYRQSIRFLYTVAFFYMLRTFTQGIFFLKMPQDYIWDYPGFFSVVVEYFPKNDFFYSGHTGMCTLCILEFNRAKLKFWKGLAIFDLVINFFILLVTRSHYSIDLIYGIFMGHYIYILGNRLHKYLQRRTNLKVFQDRDVPKNVELEDLIAKDKKLD
eukprot:CAMPEP_0114593646 /NCGR_PEP_ID=MMETSP0125-20121206/15241_1 /TAXON_ID=485358 ORGANISM="Aristerostoma sp., Strain ATCC 50986" /NCGR_SAMPLE_ID=MMETSP0125 /ASSEMBLY_ACC=CAM_ASM_000245 /LENGTH=284 /DNA_ID=CAMNT_0001793035 /DNA_START=98 /DNA_END=952 /DNA_ORIENTATION=-